MIFVIKQTNKLQTFYNKGRSFWPFVSAGKPNQKLPQEKTDYEYRCEFAIEEIIQFKFLIE